jgi:hypothetical protein
METASREDRERRDAEIRAKMDAQQRAHDERVRQLQKENDEMDRRYEEEINSRKNSKLALLIHLDLHLPLTQPPNSRGSNALWTRLGISSSIKEPLLVLCLPY